MTNETSYLFGNLSPARWRCALTRPERGCGILPVAALVVAWQRYASNRTYFSGLWARWPRPRGLLHRRQDGIPDRRAGPDPLRATQWRPRPRSRVPLQ